MATTRSDALQALRTRVEATRATWLDFAVQVEYGNLKTVNTSTQSDPYLRVRMVYIDVYQLELARDPHHRVLGTIVIESMAKEGSGDLVQGRLLDHFYRAVHMTDTMPPLRTYAARFGSSPARDGWTAEAALIPFWYDSSS